MLHMADLFNLRLWFPAFRGLAGRCDLGFGSIEDVRDKLTYHQTRTRSPAHALGAGTVTSNAKSVIRFQREYGSFDKETDFEIQHRRPEPFSSENKR